jgi:prephenate dehydrogenase
MFTKVGIFGTGLLGGSVGLGLRERFLANEVIAYDPDPTALEAARALGAADRIETRLGPWIAELDLGVLAAPVGALEALGREVARFASEGTLWTDVGSVKAPVVSALEPLLPRFVGGHQMAGS